jgi:hypothetical protein
MSSTYVRDQIKSYLTANMPTETQIDLSDKFESIDDVISDAGLTRNDPWLGLEFIANIEEPITVQSNWGKGVYREIGVVMFHVVDIAKLGAANAILPRAEAIRNILRGRRIGDIIIESVTPPNFNQGATLNFEAGYCAAIVMCSYEYDLVIS